MAMAMTLSYFPDAPEKRLARLRCASGVVVEISTYGAFLIDIEWSHIDRPLRNAVAWCLAEDLDLRPNLGSLLLTARDKVNRMGQVAVQVCKDWTKQVVKSRPPNERSRHVIDS